MCSGEPYLQLKVAHVGRIQFAITAYLLSIALSHINDVTTYPDVNTDKRTLWALSHYKVNKDGVRYFNYSDPDTGEKFDGVLTEISWFDERLEGKYVYLYGVGLDNFCWPRPIPDSEWLPSLFRSSQLKPWVQVPLRAAILLGMTFRIFQAIVLAFVRVHRAGPDFKFHVYLAKFMVLNEIFQNVSLFYVSNFLCTPDKKYLYLMGPAIIAAYITFSIKMLLSFWHSGLDITTGVRLLLFVVVTQTIVPNYKSCLAYLHYNYCDHYVPSFQAFNELAIICSLMVSELLDIYQTKEIECNFGPTEEACEDEEKIRLEASSLRSQ